MKFKLMSDFQPTGDQPRAIEQLSSAFTNQDKYQVLLGVTGSGKTFTMASIIEKIQKPTLIISHNKTLAAQLYQEFRDFFPKNAVSYFVSYYDYYQPEAYIPQTDTYIEKETEINEEIDKLRLQATTSLLTRKDVIVVASVSCIYNLGSPKDYSRYVLPLHQGEEIENRELLSKLVDLQYQRSDYELKRGSFRIKGDSLELWPAYLNQVLKIDFLGKRIDKLYWFEPITGNQTEAYEQKLVIYPAKHYMLDRNTYQKAVKNIRSDMQKRVKILKKEGKALEAQRLKQRVSYDLEMVAEFGYVNGIENYSRYFDGRREGDPPHTLIDYFTSCDPHFLTIIDESHITVPQIRGMYNGDRSRKKTLIDFGFRLPSALDNRPLKISEFLNRISQTIFTSATPGDWEKSLSSQIVEQLIRPTGLTDPEIDIRPSAGQIDDLLSEIKSRVQKHERVLVTTLTKRTAEALSEYLEEKGIKIHYLHSDIHTLDRSDILDDLRLGKYDVLVGINLLREGLDLPEVSLVAILDADKEGFLRSETSLIQTMGRASRHQKGRVIMYADQITGSMERAIREVKRRRDLQLKYNRLHKITPQSISKPIREKLIKRQPNQTSVNQIQLSKKEVLDLDSFDPQALTPQDQKEFTLKLKRRMARAARELDFELAAKIRDIINLINY